MAQAHRDLQPGEHVSWSYGAGQAKGQVVEKLTSNKKLGARVFKASPDDPKYLVKSDASGKEAIKKPETLHKIDETGGGTDNGSTPRKATKDVHSSAERDAQKREVGAKEKRDGLKQRATKVEKKDKEGDEMPKKVADTGKSSPRASAKAAKSKLKQAAAELEDVGEKRDSSYKPKEDEVKAPDDEEAIATLPTDEEVLTQADKEAKRDGMVAVDKALEAEDYTEVDRAYEPESKEAVDDKEAIDTLPPDNKMLEQVERENKEEKEEVVDDTDEKGKQGGSPTKK